MFFFLGFLAVIVAIALIFVVVIQNSKGGGLSSTFGGGASQIMGARRSNEFIEKVTWYLGAGLAVIAFLANIMAGGGSEATFESKMSEQIQNQIIENPVALPDPTQFQDAGTPAQPEGE